jgi:hypothetical protein
MLWKPFMLAPLAQIGTGDLWNLVLGMLFGFIVLFVLFGLFVAPILIWRARVRRSGYPGLLAYFRELPKTDLEKMDAVELTLKGVVLCALGLLFPPLVVIGLVPLYYGLRKLAALQLGITKLEAD